ncbi:Predicted arabinose efflux permease, MFS family [Thalassospira xiamenensis M-5 = DSM 17429]|uniref:Transporter n=1 Tax=Thalassospira xiamenensis M-5 = DSM 17429 TaxID=1123366 RepID=A0AB72UFS0_9PROT|nr:MFS transporter [Thalassospira xiamenensis]AJD53022.1 transporter [Thalassospira xiamenensis M-5 = DSM 17429]SIT29168.1 Predicted arabinose efflux permease, MFS family [Thalassospira xiamenensis M-5 = DSM 17429]
MITRALVIKLGLGQLISWGTAYYLIGNFGTLIAQHHGWSDSVVYAGFSASLLTMAVISPFCGRMIDRHGGRIIMTLGSCLNALGCLILAFADHQIMHFIGWIILGLAMRATLYDAAFATLARIGGRDARRAMGQITLFGGLASTVFWPLGHLIQSEFGITIALVVYAAFALLTVPMYAAIPDARHGKPSGTTLNSTDNTNDTSNADDHGLPTHQRLCGFLYAVIVTLLNVVNAAMSAHMIAILIGLGLTTAAAINAASLRGIGQSAARAAEILFGKRIAPASLTLFATAVLPLCFVLAFWGDQFAIAAMTFTLLYGAANGVLTITRGTLPLMIFGNARYGHQVGRLLVPGFILSALAPSLYERAIAHWGPNGALWLSIGLLACACGAAIWLYLLLRPQRSETRPALIVR